MTTVTKSATFSLVPCDTQDTIVVWEQRIWMSKLGLWANDANGTSLVVLSGYGAPVLTTEDVDKYLLAVLEDTPPGEIQKIDGDDDPRVVNWFTRINARRGR